MCFIHWPHWLPRGLSTSDVFIAEWLKTIKGSLTRCFGPSMTYLRRSHRTGFLDKFSNSS
jgi:hypothetical protein